MTALPAPPQTAPQAPPLYETLADLLAELGDIPLNRIRFFPYPGTATDEDVLRAEAQFGGLFELIDGVLVEKPMGFYESRLAGVLLVLLGRYDPDDTKVMAFGGDGQVRTDRRRVRLPDVSIYLWERFPNRVLPAGQILELTPDIAVEVISPSNTEREMDTKRREYFRNGVRQVWQVYPETRSVRVYTSPARFTELTEADTLDGGDVLPGFQLSVADWFRRAGERATE